MTEEEKKAIDYFKEKIKNKLPLYEETYIDGKPYRRNILQLETNFTEEQANKTETLLNLIEKQQKEIESLKKMVIEFSNEREKLLKTPVISKDKIREKIKYYQEMLEEAYNSPNLATTSEYKPFINLLEELLKEGDK